MLLSRNTFQAFRTELKTTILASQFCCSSSQQFRPTGIATANALQTKHFHSSTSRQQRQNKPRYNYVGMPGKSSAKDRTATAAGSAANNNSINYVDGGNRSRDTSPKFSDFLKSIDKPNTSSNFESPELVEREANPTVVKAPNITERVDRIADSEQKHAKHAREFRRAAKDANVSVQSFTAFKSVSDALRRSSSNAEPEQSTVIESDILRKLREHESITVSRARIAAEQFELSDRFNNILADMAVDKTATETEPGSMPQSQPSTWVERVIWKAAEQTKFNTDAAFYESDADASREPEGASIIASLRDESMREQRARPERYFHPRRSQHQQQQPTVAGHRPSSSIKVFDGPGLGIFTGQPNLLLEERDNVMLTWNQLVEQKLQYQRMQSPRNAYEEMILWTNQGRLWKFPIDNEQDMPVDGSFDEHIFLMPTIDDFPKTGPIREFMEIVVYGLSSNPWITLKEKHEHVDWFRKYFKDKQSTLDNALADKEMVTFSEQTNVSEHLNKVDEEVDPDAPPIPESTDKRKPVWKL